MRLVLDLDAIQPILPGNNFANASFSNIQGGTNNTVQAGSTRSSILGGWMNRIINNSQWSSILGGISHRIDDSEVSTIVGGHQNEINITGASVGYGVVVNGYQNLVTHEYSAIIGARAKSTDRTYTTFMEGLDVDTNRQSPLADSQAFRYHGTFANPGLRRFLMDVDGLGNAVWTDLPIPPQDPGCPYVSAFTTNSGCTLVLVNCSGGTFTADTCNTFGAISPYEYRASQSISTVLPNGGTPTDNFIHGTQQYSNIQGGHSNKINTNGSAQNAIGGGLLNIIGGTTPKFPQGNIAWSNIGGGYHNRLTGNDQYYMNIGGGRRNKILDGGYGHIGGGNENIITASTRSFIGGGDFNKIWPNSSYSSVVGGEVNHIIGNVNSIIGGGSFNTIYAKHSIIGGGAFNTIGSPIGGTTTHAGIFAGSGNTITRSAEYAGIVNGLGNTVNAGYSAIIGGAGLTTNRDHTTFMEGLDVDTARGLTTPAQAFKYHGQFANPGINKFLMDSDGLGNAVWAHLGIPPVSGDCYVVSASTNSATCVTTFYLNGTCGTVTAQTCDGSFSPYRPTGIQSIVPTVPGGLAWNTNVIDPGSNNSNVGGGELNRILGGSTNSLVAGGRSNRVINNSTWSNIGGGVANLIDDSQVSSIVGGHHNEINIAGFGVGYGLIGGGFQNKVENQYGSVINGRDNTVEDDFSAIIGARGRTTDRTYTTFTEGLDVDSARADGAPDGQSFRYHGAFASPGLGSVLTDIDGTGTAQWRPPDFPPVDPGCPYVSAFTTNSGCTLHLIDCSGNTITADTCSTFGAVSPYRFGAFGAWNSIEPILTPVSANAQLSSVGGGIMNTIFPGALAARIGGGIANWIILDSPNSYIGGGTGNRITDAFASSIVGGTVNLMGKGGHSFIGGGITNRISNVGISQNYGNFIGSGTANRIPGEQHDSSIVGGAANSINNDSDYNFIGGGFGNHLGNTTNILWTNYSSILGGKHNGIYGDGVADYAAIVNGSGNTVEQMYSAVIGGRGLTASRSHTTFMQGLDVDTNHDNRIRPFRYHGGPGGYANEGTPGDVLTSTNILGDAQWRPGGVVWTYGCPIVSATSVGCILTLINCTGGTITADTCTSFGMLSPYELRGGLDSISTVLPNLASANTNFISPALAFSNIQGGEYNSLNSDGQFNAILGGQSNFIGAGGGATIPGAPGPSPQGNIYWSNIGGGGENQIRGYDVMGDTIAGGRRNVLTATTNSVIAGGWSNRIYKGQRHTIGGGAFNKISEDAYSTQSSTIGGGENNTIFYGDKSIIGGGDGNTITQGSIGYGSFDSFIGGGDGNLIEGGHQSAIVGGDGNTITQWAIGQGSYDSFIGGGDNNFVKGGHQSAIVGGEDNTISNSADWTHMFIGGGKDNTVSDSQKSSIVGGEDNTINLNSNYASILGGFQNTITPGFAGADYGAIVNGSDNTVNQIYSAIIGGANLTTNRQYTTFMEGLDVNTNRGGAGNAQAFKYHGTFANNGTPGDVLTAVDALGNAQWQPLGIPPVSGDCYVVSATTNSATCVTTFYLNGDCGTVTAKTCDGSFSPYRPIGNQSIVPTVPGGFAWNTNVIDPGSNNSNVGGGELNRILGGSTNSLIAGGRSNRITNNSTWSNIGGGVANLIDDSQVSSILGGHHNDINIAGFGIGYGVITGGFQNTVTEQYGSIINGRDNDVNHQYSAIIGAQGRTTDRTFTTFTEGLDVDSNRADGALDGQAFRYYGTFASPGLRRILTDIDGLGNAVWMEPPNPPQDPNCPFVSAFTTNSGCTLHLINCTGGTFTADTCNTFGGVSPYQIGAGLDSIEPVMMPGSANANYSNVQGGFNNNIHNTCRYSSIVGGNTNNIGLESLNSFIGNGEYNTITDASGTSSIVGGKDNRIDNKSNYSSIVGGNINIINGGTMSIIGGGDRNKITGTTESFIGSGQYNKIFDSHHSNITSGLHNRIIENTWYSHIGAGAHNHIKGGTAGLSSIGTYSSAIAAGYNNIITKAHPSTASDYSFIGAGTYNVLSGAPTSTIVTGTNNKIIQIEGSAGILTGNENLIKGSSNAAIVNGSDNTINGGWTSSAVIGADDRVVDRTHTTFIEGLDADTSRGGLSKAQAFKYHGTWAQPGLNYVLTDIDGLGNAQWQPGTTVRQDPNCPFVSAFTTNSGCTLHLVNCTGGTFTADTCNTFGAVSPYRFAANPSALFAIEPELMPGSANGMASSVGGGLGHNISATHIMSRIGGGIANRIEGGSGSVSYIGGGNHNILSASTAAIIVGGSRNLIDTSYQSAIVSGRDNIIGSPVSYLNSAFNFIGGGELNRIWDDTSYSSVVGGLRNSINNDSNYNFIGGGFGNRLGYSSVWTNYSSILGGKYNKIAGDSTADYAAIVNGSGNTVEQHYSAVIGGRELTANRSHTTFMQGLDVNTDHVGVTRPFRYHGTYANHGNPGDVLTAMDALGNASWQPIGIPPVSGDCYVVSASTNSATCVTTFYLNGDCGSVTAQTCDGSYSPYRPTGTQSIVPTVPGLGGFGDNIIDISSNNSNVGGGTFNRIMNNSDTSVISGGRNNRIRENATWSNIGGGVSNIIEDSAVSSILGGHKNEIVIPGIGVGYGVITGGYENKVENRYGSIINGAYNTVEDDFSAIIGAQNKTTDRTYTTFTEGLDVDSNRGGAGNAQAFKYHGTFASPANDRILTSVDNLGNAQWRDSGIMYTGDEVVVSAQTIGCILTLTTNSGNTITANTCTTYSGPYKGGQGTENIIPTSPQGAFANYTSSDSGWSTIQGGLLNKISGSTVSTIVGGIGNFIQDSSYSSILGGVGNMISASTRSVIINGLYNRITGGTTDSVIMGTSGIKAYTDQTTYTGHQQVLGKVRLSSQEYNNTNSLNHSLAKMTLDVVHDTATIRGMGNNEGGGEIVRFGDLGDGYAIVLVY